MISLPKNVRVFIWTAPQDMRKQAFGLSSVVQATTELDPRAGDLFLFVSRRRTMLKALFHDGQGYVLLVKRLDHGAFCWVDGTGTTQIDGDTLGQVLTKVRIRKKKS